MDLTTITIADFKAWFARDFSYLPVYTGSKSYKVNDVVYYEVNESFYICILASTGNLPTDPIYWSSHDDNVENYVLDADINKAFAEATQMFNQSLFSDDDEITMGYLYLTAHFLSYDIRVALSGILSSGAYPVKMRKVGNVTEEFEIPTAFVNVPIYSFYAKTGYGLKYLNMIFPKTVGHMALLSGTTTPNWQTENLSESGASS